eukprot:1927361-Alexandrium_andersonii.AAC.1
MSASLVGSEMCIRDSARATQAELSRPSYLLTSRSQTPLLQRPSPRPCAVSYTHLTLPTICSV